MAQMVKNLPAKSGFHPWVRKIPWRREWLPTQVFLPGNFHGAEEPGGLQFMELRRVSHDWVTNTFTLTLGFRHRPSTGLIAICIYIFGERLEEKRFEISSSIIYSDFFSQNKELLFFFFFLWHKDKMMTERYPSQFSQRNRSYHS